MAPRPSPRSLAAVLVATAVSLSASSALAFERQWHAGFGLGLRPTSISGVPGGGVAPLAVASLAYGLTDQFDVLAEVGLARPRFETAPGTDESGRQVFSTTADLGIVYTLDVLRVVPFGGVFVGAHHLGAGKITLPEGTIRTFGGAVGLDLGGALGARYQYDRDLAFGFDVRYHRPLALPETTQAMGIYLSASYTWGYLRYALARPEVYL